MVVSVSVSTFVGGQSVGKGDQIVGISN